MSTHVVHFKYVTTRVSCLLIVDVHTLSTLSCATYVCFYTLYVHAVGVTHVTTQISFLPIVDVPVHSIMSIVCLFARRDYICIVCLHSVFIHWPQYCVSLPYVCFTHYAVHDWFLIGCLHYVFTRWLHYRVSRMFGINFIVSLHSVFIRWSHFCVFRMVVFTHYAVHDSLLPSVSVPFTYVDFTIVYFVCLVSYIMQNL